MKKIQAMLVLMIALAFGGATAQTWAVVAQTLVPPQGVKWAVPPQGVEWAVLPQGVELSDEKLAQVYGEWLPIIVKVAKQAGSWFAQGFFYGAGAGAGAGAICFALGICPP